MQRMSRPILRMALTFALALAGNAGRAAEAGGRVTAPEAEKAFAEGNYAEAYRQIAAAIEACQPRPELPDRCLSLLILAPSIALAADLATDAERLARQASAVAETLGEAGRRDQVLALAALGGALTGQGRVRDAEAVYRRTLPIAASLGPDSPFTAIVENSLSLILDAQGRFAEAEPLHRSSLVAIMKMPGTAAAIPTLTAGLADNLAGQGRFAEADPEYRRALELARTINGARHPAVAQIMNSLALNAQKRGAFAEAERLFRAAAEINLEKLGADHALAGRDASNLGALYLDWGKLPDAERQFRQALAISEKTGGPNHPAVASDLGNLGGVLRLEGRAGEAEASIRRALAIDSAEFGPDGPRAAGHYGNIAASLEDQGRYAEGEGLRRRAYDIYRRMGGDESGDAAASAIDLAGNLAAQSKFAEAEKLLVDAITVRRSKLGERHPSLATGYSHLGVLLAKSGRDREARVAFDSALEIDLAALGPMAPRTAGDYHNLAAIMERTGEIGSAEMAGRKALSIRRAILAPSHPDIANSERLLGQILAHRDEARAEALTLLRDAMAIARGRRTRDFSGEAAGDDVAAISSAQVRARSFDVAASDPLARPVATFIQIAAARARDRPSEQAVLRDEAFLAAQDLDVSLAALTMAQTAARTAQGQGPLADLVRRQQDLADRSRLLDRRLIEALAAGRSEQAGVLRTEVERVGVELAEVDGQLRKVFPSYAALIAPRTLSVSQVRQRLRGDEGLLLIKPVGEDLILFAVTGARAAWHSVVGGKALVAADVDLLRCQVDRDGCHVLPAGGTAQPGADFDPAPAHRLYDRLIAPLDDALKQVTKLYVTTSGPLADLPLDMLVPASGGWLADRYAITVLPAVSVLKLGPAKMGEAVRQPFLGYGDPDFGVRARDNFLALPAAAGAEHAADESPMFEALAPLPGTRIELTAMAEALGAPRDAMILGDAATEGAVRGDPRLARSRVVAFATHGFLPNEISGRSEAGLIFTPPKSVTPQDDGVLAASEASTLTVSADWLVLSACNTASSVGGSDSLSALSRAFLYAGAKALLASHWRVSDEATAALTVEIIATDRAHPLWGRSRARQEAMRALRTGHRRDGSAVKGWDKSWAHPSAWAPFALIASDGG